MIYLLLILNRKLLTLVPKLKLFIRANQSVRPELSFESSLKLKLFAGANLVFALYFYRGRPRVQEKLWLLRNSP